MKTSFELSATFSATPETIYDAWLDSDGHSEMTGGAAVCSKEVGGTFTAWENYISGTNTALIPSQRIEQRWRTTQFEAEDADSILVVEFRAAEGGCEVVITHSEIPEGQPDYHQGWIDHYFDPMQEYFGS